MPLPGFIRRKLYGRTVSEQRTNAEDEAWAAPRGKGASAKDGKDGVAREQLAAKRLNELGFERIQVVETHSGGRLSFDPLGRDEQYDRIAPGLEYDERRRNFLRRALLLGGAGAAIAIGSGAVGNLIGRSQATPGGAVNGPGLTSSGDIDAKRIGGVRYATEFDSASHAGTGADPFTRAAIANALADAGVASVICAAVQFNLASGLSYDGPLNNPVLNKSIEGMGPASYLHHTGTDTQVISLTNAINWRLLDFKIDTTSASTDAILLGLAQEILVRGLQVRSFSGGAAVRLYQSQYCHVLHLDAYNSGCLYGLYFTDQTHPILGGGKYNLRDDVIGCDVRATAASGVGAEVLLGHDLQFIADNFENCPVAGMRFNAPAAAPSGGIDGNELLLCNFENNPINIHVGVTNNLFPRATRITSCWFGGNSGGSNVTVDFARNTVIRDCVFENSGTNTIILTANQLWAVLDNIMGLSADVTVTDSSGGAYMQRGLNRAGSAVFHQIPAPETVKLSNLQPDATSKSGIAARVKAGAPVDGDFTTAVDGLMVCDTTNNKWWIRVGGVWKGVGVA